VSIGESTLEERLIVAVLTEKDCPTNKTELPEQCRIVMSAQHELCFCFSCSQSLASAFCIMLCCICPLSWHAWASAVCENDIDTNNTVINNRIRTCTSYLLFAI